MSKKSSKGTQSNASVRTSIEEQTAAFLKSGGSIQHIDKGTSGQVIPTSPSKSKR